MSRILTGLLALVLWAPIAAFAAAPTPIISFGTPAPSVPSTTTMGTALTTIVVKMSDGTIFDGAIAFGGAYGNGSSACALTSTGTLLVSPTAATLTDSDGVWSFGASDPGYGYHELLNGSNSGGIGVLFLSYNSHTYSGGIDGRWYEWLSSAWSNIAGDPRPGQGNITLGQTLTAGTYNCSITATQGSVTVGKSITITVTAAAPAATPIVNFSPSSGTATTATTVGAVLSTVTATMSDGSTFTGSVAFGGTYGNGSGACALTNTSTIIAAPTTSTLSDSDGVWSFGTVLGSSGYPILLNGVQSAGGGSGSLIVSYNSHTYVKNVPGTWYEYLSSSWSTVAGDPRPGQGNITLGKTLTAGTDNCTIVATQGAASASGNFTITVTAPAPAPTPIVNFSPSSGTATTATTVGTMLSTVTATMSNGSTFTGSVAFGGTYGNGSSACALSSATVPSNLTLGKTLTAGTYNCTVVATQGMASASGNFTITVTAPAPTPIINFNPTSGSAMTTTTAGTPLATLAITMSNGSTFTGSLAFGGTYGNGSGACALSSTSIPSNLTLGKTLAAGTYNCTVLATQGTQTTSGNFSLTVTSVPTPQVTLNPASVTIQTTAPTGSSLSAITVTMSDGSMFTGNLTLGGTYGNGSGACALTGTGTTLVAPTTNTLTDSDGVWSFGTALGQYGYPILLNGVQSGGGAASLILSYNGHTYVKNVPGTWYEWLSSSWSTIAGDPRPAGQGTVTLGKTLAAGSDNCTIVATQGTVTGSANIAITVMAAATPTVVLTPSSVSVASNLPVGMALSVISVTMSDGSTFSGSLVLGGTYGNDGGICAISGKNLTLGKALPAGASTQNCTVVATQGVATASANMVITVVAPAPIPVVTFNPTAASIQTTTAIGTAMSAVTTTMSDGSMFTGNLTLGGTYGSGSGACALTIGGTTLVAPTTNTLTDSDGVWGFGSVSDGVNGYAILLNGTQASGGIATLLLSYNGHTYANNLKGEWFEWLGSAWPNIAGDPRPPGADNVTLGKTLTAGTYNCTVVATQGTATGSANIAVTVTAPATPTVTLGTPSPSIQSTTAVGTPLSTIAVSLSNGSTFTGSLALSGTYGNGSGACALSNTALPANVTLGELLTAGTYNCTVVATQGVSTASANIAITVTGLTYSLTLNPTSITIQDNTPPGSVLSTITVTDSDGSTFAGTLSFVAPYGNGGGTCALSSAPPTIIAPTTATLSDSDGTWSFGPTVQNPYGYPLLLNGAQAAGGLGNEILSYNGSTYAENLQGSWYQWTGSWEYLGSTDPAPLGAGSIILGPAFTDGTFNCTVDATQ